MKIIKDLVQQSDEWFDIRSTRMTASNAAAIGNKGAGLRTYIYKKVQEEYSTKKPEPFSNKHTDRGNKLEPVAATLYELETGNTVEKIGIVIVDKWVCISPDRFVNTNGLSEIKCPDDKNHFHLIQTGKIEKKYLWQMNMQMHYCKKEWCDFTSYNPNYEKSLIIQRVFPDEKLIEDIKEGVEKGKKLMIKLRENMNA